METSAKWLIVVWDRAFHDTPPKWLTNPWRWLRCRMFQYHSWIDTNGDGLTDTCAICGTGPFAKWSPRPRSDYVIAIGLTLCVTGTLLFFMNKRDGIKTGARRKGPMIPHETDLYHSRHLPADRLDSNRDLGRAARLG